MRKRLPPLNPLRAFEATARLLSVSRAAAELNVTPGAISHQIRTLEQALKVSLFQRSGGRMRLSNSGAALHPSVSAAFDTIAEASALLTRRRTEGDLIVSSSPALAAFWLIPRLGAFAQRYPGIRLKLLASRDGDELSSSDVDVAVRYGDGNWSDGYVTPWTEIALFPVCSPTLINARPLRDVSDLRSHTLLHGDDGSEWASWLKAAQVSGAKKARSYSMTSALALEAAIHGHGVALGDTVTSSRLLAGGVLIMPFELKVPATHAFYIVSRKELRAAPIVGAFTDWLTTQIAD